MPRGRTYKYCFSGDVSSGVSSNEEYSPPAKPRRIHHGPRNKTLHQCLKQDLKSRFIFLLANGASLMKLDKHKQTVIEVILRDGPVDALPLAMKHSTWLISSKSDKNKLLGFAAMHENTEFTEFLVAIGANIFSISSRYCRYGIKTFISNKAVLFLNEFMINRECKTVNILHNDDPNSWLYKDYLCPDIFRIIIDYLQY